MPNTRTAELPAHNDKKHTSLVKRVLRLATFDEMVKTLSENMSVSEFDRAISILDAELERHSNSATPPALKRVKR